MLATLGADLVGMSMSSKRSPRVTSAPTSSDSPGRQRGAGTGAGVLSAPTSTPPRRLQHLMSPPSCAACWRTYPPRADDRRAVVVGQEAGAAVIRLRLKGNARRRRQQGRHQRNTVGVSEQRRLRGEAVGARSFGRRPSPPSGPALRLRHRRRVGRTARLTTAGTRGAHGQADPEPLDHLHRLNHADGINS